MFAPRWLIAAGIALIAVSLGAAGHGLWWLVGLVFVLGHRRHHWDSCGHRGHRHHGGYRQDVEAPARERDDAPAETPVAQPDPTRDHHEAFPIR